MSPGLVGALALAISYLIGSIDFAVVVARMHGVDIHQVGSGNPGATNVLRALGRAPAVMVFVGDALKGVLAAGIGVFLTGASTPLSPWVFAAGLAAVVGHCYPVFHRFRGGKGVATSAGVIFFALPLVGVLLVVIWAVTARLTRISSVASLTVVAATLPLAVWQGLGGVSLLLLGGNLLLVVYRHRGNISRILKRSEGKVSS
jgi:glycerol-3-phosphate acyltransferase PlsY